MPYTGPLFHALLLVATIESPQNPPQIRNYGFFDSSPVLRPYKKLYIGLAILHLLFHTHKKQLA
jgi:hypothetical protein